MTELGMVLRVDPLRGEINEIAGEIIRQCGQEEELEFRECEVRGLQGRLDEELREMSLLRGWLEQSSRGQELKLDLIDEKISEWGRGIKLIHAKTEEYRSRVMNTKVSIPHLVSPPNSPFFSAVGYLTLCRPQMTILLP